MLHRYNEVFRSGIMGVDLALVSASWFGAYWVRFHTGFAAEQGIPPFAPYYGQALFAIIPLWWVLFRSHGLYESRRTGLFLQEAGAVLGATTLGLMILMTVSFFYRDFSYSRGVVGLFCIFSTTSILLSRASVRGVLRSVRRRGVNQRFVVVVGAGRLAEEVIERIHRHPETGLRVLAAFADGVVGQRSVAGVQIGGGFGDLKPFLRDADRIDELIIALSREEMLYFEKVIADLDNEITSLRIVPDLLGVMTLRSSVEDLDGLPMISLREGPLLGWAGVQKRAFDLALSSLLILLNAPLLFCVSTLVALSSGRPIFYRQERMGLDGQVFSMLKFRTMRAGAEADSGPVWTTPDDSRTTRFGGFLRRTSLDELPQLWNVLRGDMSLVGPRPERPFFIAQFRSEIPGYMLRLKVKAGLTGWAQVHGWRGNTSIQERLEHDIHYIQNWSLGLDIRILLMTLWKGLVNRNAY